MFMEKSSLKLGCRDTSLRVRSLFDTKMCWDMRDVERKRLTKKIAYYNLPRGKWSTLIKYMLRWRKWADRWQHWSARATLSIKNEKEKTVIFNLAANIFASIRWKSVSVVLNSSGETSKMSMNRAKVMVWFLNKG